MLCSFTVKKKKPKFSWLPIRSEKGVYIYSGVLFSSTQLSFLTKCFTFQSYLIANHLPKEDLLDVCLYCQHYCLLPLAAEQRVGQLVIWREVFPQQRANGGGGGGSSTAPGYSQPQGRHFLLIVGLVRRRVAAFIDFSSVLFLCVATKIILEAVESNSRGFLIIALVFFYVFVIKQLLV